MKKSNFVALILGTVGGVFFALGMCMALLPEWGMETQGVVCGVIGLAVLLAALLSWERGVGRCGRAAVRRGDVPVPDGPRETGGGDHRGPGGHGCAADAHPAAQGRSQLMK